MLRFSMKLNKYWVYFCIWLGNKYSFHAFVTWLLTHVFIVIYYTKFIAWKCQLLGNGWENNNLFLFCNVRIISIFHLKTNKKLLKATNTVCWRVQEKTSNCRPILVSLLQKMGLILICTLNAIGRVDWVYICEQADLPWRLDLAPL